MQSSYSLSEGSGAVSICVVLDRIIELNVQVELSTVDRTATGNNTYIIMISKLTFPPSHLSS